jgi:peptide deformylase
LILEIVTHPDKRLKGKSKEVEKFDEKLHTLLDNMFDTMNSREGIGLAGIQIGVPKRVFITYIQNGEDTEPTLTEFINPKILAESGVLSYEEGCLSIPSYFEKVDRAETINVSYQNRYGEEQNSTLHGLNAVAFQHELDHLNGKLFVERVSYMKRKKFEKEWKRRGREN